MPGGGTAADSATWGSPELHGVFKGNFTNPTSAELQRSQKQQAPKFDLINRDTKKENHTSDQLPQISASTSTENFRIPVALKKPIFAATVNVILLQNL